MLSKVLCFCFLPVFLGCAWLGDQPSVVTLSNEDFSKRTLAGVSTGGTNQLQNAKGGATNTVDNSGLKAKLIIPGARVTIAVDQDASLNREFLIKPGGMVEFPPLGNITVEGLTGEELEQELKTKLEKDYFSAATVHVNVEREFGGGVIYVLGSVTRPGPIALPVNEKFTVLKAMLAAGGPTPFGNSGKIKVIRYGEDGKKYQTVVNLDRIQAAAEFEKDIALMNGDWLIVPEKLFNF